MIEVPWKESSLGAALETLAEERGLARGMAQGMAQGMQQLAQAALEARIGALSADVVEALRAADEQTLVALVADTHIVSVEGVRRRLALPR